MRIFIKEEQIGANAIALRDSMYMLPRFIVSHLKTHKTSLGDNPCFPSEREFAFDYKICKERYKEIIDALSKYPEFNNMDVDKAKNLCNKLISECKKIEDQHEEYFEDLCKETVKAMLMVPDDTVIFDCELTDEVEPSQHPRIMPEDNEYQFDDVADMDMSDKAVLKRRIINSLIQGASNTYARKIDYYADKIEKINPNLIDLYEKIMLLNDYILFNDDIVVDENSYHPSAYVEVILGTNNEKTEIHSQGLIFPFLLQETIRGFFELFASHALPQDNQKAMYLISHADFVLAESWDLRFGCTLWKDVTETIDNDAVIPFYFTNLCEIPTEEFFKEMKEILSKTRHGLQFMNDLVERSASEITFDDVPNDVAQQDIKSILSDEDLMTIEELNEIKID